MSRIQALSAFVSRTLIVIGLCAVSFMAGATFRTTANVSFHVTSGAEASEQQRQVEILASALPARKAKEGGAEMNTLTSYEQERFDRLRSMVNRTLDTTPRVSECLCRVIRAENARPATQPISRVYATRTGRALGVVQGGIA